MRIRGSRAALLGLIDLPGAAGAQPASVGSYVGGGLFLQDVNGYDDGMGLNVRGATALPGVLNDGVPGAVSLEGELTRSLVSPEHSLPPTATGDSVAVDITTLGGYGVYTYPAQRFRLRGRFGLIYENIAADDGYHDDSEVGLSLGFGAGYMVTGRVEVAANYTYIEDDVEHLGINALYHF